MKETQEPISFKVFSVDKTDIQFKNILAKCKAEMTHSEINEVIRNELQNRVIIAKPFGHDGIEENIKLYRITDPFDDFDLNNINHYSHPPKAKTVMGRANVAGFPVLYCSVDEASALMEMKSQLQPGKKFYLSCWQLDVKRPVFAHVLLYNSNTISKDGLISDLAKNQEQQMRDMSKEMPQDAQDGFIHSIKKMGDIFCSSGTDYYHITSAHSYDVLYDIGKQEMSISWIMYPSIANEHDGINFAIHPAFVKEMMRIETIVELTVSEITGEGVNIQVHRKAEVINDIIQWKGLRYRIVNAHYQGLKILTYNNEFLEGEKYIDLKINGSDLTVKGFIVSALQRVIDEGHLTKMHARQNPDFLNITKESHQEDILLKYSHGNQIETNKGLSCINQLIIPVTWTCEYENLSESDNLKFD